MSEFSIRLPSVYVYVIAAAQTHIKVLRIVFLSLCMNICYVFVCVYACPDLSELLVFLSAPSGPAAERESESDSPSR